MMEITSDKYYTEVGPLYPEISKARSNYLKAVDAIVVSAAQGCEINNWLDIGTGNGKRLCGLMKEISADEVVCLEPSTYMFHEASQNLDKKCTLINKNLAEYSSDTVSRFSFVTALWNVIGHSEDSIDFLRGAYARLDSEGVLLIDANNRYNIRQYGLLPVIRNIILDYLGLSSNGIFKLRTNDENAFTYVYISSPHELHKACRALEMADFEIKFVDYMTGNPAGFLTGQMVATISRKKERFDTITGKQT